MERFDRTAKHVTCIVLAIITYVRTSYFQVTSKIPLYFGSTLEVMKYF